VVHIAHFLRYGITVKKLLGLILLLPCLFVPGRAQSEPVPADLLDFSAWRLTLPESAEPKGRPTEIEAGELAEFAHADFFFAEPATKAVVFRAPCGGTTTKNSSYPRSELREMTADGTKRASWGTKDGTVHEMSLRVAIRKTPKKKRHVVCAQIHDADDDLAMIRLEGTHLFVERNKLPAVTLTRDYQLGDVFELKFIVSLGRVRVWYDGEQEMNWKIVRDGCYFKAGCYTQSNPKKGDAAEDYGEVAIYDLKVSHRPIE